MLNEDGKKHYRIKGEKCYRDSNFEEALKYFLPLKSEEPDNYELLENIANCFKNLYRFDEEKEIRDILEKHSEVKSTQDLNDSINYFPASTAPLSRNPQVDKFLEWLLIRWKLRDQIIAIRTYKGKNEEYGKLLKPFTPPITKHIQNFKGLYSHQCETIFYIQTNQDVILTTATASGKTLAFNLPILDHLLQNPKSKALYLYPTKALTNDQLLSIKKIIDEEGLNIDVEIFDGDTPIEKKNFIKSHADIIFSNPYKLHYILREHHSFATFFKNLKFIVLDEAHTYHGVYGSNIAFLIRRLERICKYYNSNPQFILLSATIANKAEFAKKLTHKPVMKVVDSDGSRQYTKHYIFFKPQDENQDRFISSLIGMMMKKKNQSLCFVRRRLKAETLVKDVTDFLKFHPILQNRITGYHSKLEKKTKDQILDKFRMRTLLALISTNALEVGIDIGSIDSVICAGFPGSLMSTRQQFGRAGRKSDAINFFIPIGSPLDNYYISHPDELLEREVEHAVIDLENENIFKNHLLCAAKELEITPLDTLLFGNSIKNHLKILVSEKNLREENGVWYSTPLSDRIHNEVHLDDIPDNDYRIMNEGKLVVEMNRWQVQKEAHKEAVLWHNFIQYVIPDIDYDINFEKKVVQAIKEKVDYKTRPNVSTGVQEIAELDTNSLGTLEIKYGSLKVLEYVTSYKRIKDEQVISEHPLSLKPIEFITKGIWFQVPDLSPDLHIDPDFLVMGLNGAKNAILRVASVVLFCDISNLGAHGGRNLIGLNSNVIVIFDKYEGGIGLSKKCLEKSVFHQIINMAIQLVKDCPCNRFEGCPSCIMIPEDWDNVDSQVALLYLEAIQKEIFNENDICSEKTSIHQKSEEAFAETKIDPELKFIQERCLIYNTVGQALINSRNLFPDIENLITQETNLPFEEYLSLNETSIGDVHGLLNKEIQPYLNESHQLAYVLLYYPFYVETIYRELLGIHKYLEYIALPRDLGVNVYCCGPAPEVIGISSIFKSFEESVFTLDFHFYEKNDWDKVRNLCISNFLPKYETFDLHQIQFNQHTGFDFFSLQNDSIYVDETPIINSKIHVFQNCLRDLAFVGGSNEIVIKTLYKFLNSISRDSIVIFIDLEYDEIKTILQNIREKVMEDNQFIILRNNIDQVLTYKPNIWRQYELFKFLEENTYETGKVRKKTKYRSLIIGKL